MFVPVLGSIGVLLAALALHEEVGSLSEVTAPSRMIVLLQEEGGEEDCECETENLILVIVNGCGLTDIETLGTWEPGECNSVDTYYCREEQGANCKGQSYTFSASAVDSCCENYYGDKNGQTISGDQLLAGFPIFAPGSIECNAESTMVGGEFYAKMLCEVPGNDPTIEHVEFVWHCLSCPAGIPF